MLALKLSAVFLVAAAALDAAVFTITPETIYACSNGLGHATVAWSNASGPVQVRIGSAQGSPLTGFESTSGSSTTGDWIPDNMSFYLVNQQGTVEATVTARVRCGATVNTLEQGLEHGSYFPLQVGNTWVYRVNSRQETSTYVTHSIISTEIVGGLTYFVLAATSYSTPTILSKLRADADGRIWQLTDTSPRESIYLDPSTLRKGAFVSAIGTFSDAGFCNDSNPLGYATCTYIRGIGMARSELIARAGSSGGFVSSLELIEVRLADGVRLAVRSPRIGLSMESTTLDVTGKKVTNCAVPLYCVACTFFGADPANTYKPCTQARVEGSAPGRYTFELELRDSADQVVYRAQPSPSVNGDLLRYVQIQLYSRPNVPIPAGTYKLIGRLKSDTEELASSVMYVRIF